MSKTQLMEYNSPTEALQDNLKYAGSTYRKMYRAILQLCKNVELRLIETDSNNENVIATFQEDWVILNTGYKRKGSSKGLTDFYELIKDAVRITGTEVQA